MLLLIPEKVMKTPLCFFVFLIAVSLSAAVGTCCPYLGKRAVREENRG